MKSIRSFLDNLEKLKPIPTSADPLVYRDRDIKAVVFDIYGTLLISSSGDIEEAELSVNNVLNSFEAVGISLNGSDKKLSAAFVISEYLGKIQEHKHIKNIHENQFPEVDTREIWFEVFKILQSMRIISGNIDKKKILEFAFIFELLSNPVYPMPGMKNIIKYLNQKKIPLGIVSNAQFYSPPIMNYFLLSELSKNENIEYFDAELLMFSYKFLKSKPDLSLFQALIPLFKRKYSLDPKNILFVGNDMLKDIMPSSMCGFKTALFAGDKRSLRLREDKDLLKKFKPDFIVTELKQIKKILAD